MGQQNSNLKKVNKRCNMCQRVCRQTSSANHMRMPDPLRRRDEKQNCDSCNLTSAATDSENNLIRDSFFMNQKRGLKS